MNPTRLQVFISSVMGAEDVRPYRRAAREAIQSLKLTVPWAFEVAPAEPSRADDVYLREVRNSDLLVLIILNSHSDAVQRELDAATDARRPVLAFVQEVEPAAQSAGRLEVIRWLQARVKYREFSDLDDLRQAISDSVAAELVRGYRAYRIGAQDFRLLVDRVQPPPGLVVRPARLNEQESIAEILGELNGWYPDIGPWIGRVLSDARDAESNVRVAEVGGQIAGVALVRDKDSSVRKFSTIYVRPTFQGLAIGPHLVHEEVTRAAEDGIRKAYVTFADELAQSLAPILTQYGFVGEGVSAGRYRPASAEWVFSKTFVRQRIGASDFVGFVEQHLVRQAGGIVLGREEGELLVRVPRIDLFGLGVSREFHICVSVSPEPERDYERAEGRFRGSDWIFVSMYGRLASLPDSDERTNWIDGADLATRFYPVEFVTEAEDSLLVTIKPAFADALVPQRARPGLFAPDRLQIRPDNVYYRSPDRWKSLRRGARILFYVSAPEQSIRGEGRIMGLRVDTPEECLAQFGNMGLFQTAELDAIAAKHGGRVLAIAFDWFREFGRPVPLRRVKDLVPGYSPRGATLVGYGARHELLLAGEG